MTREEKKTKLYSALISLGTLALVAVLMLVLGLYYQNPPPPEYGIEVNLGYNDSGLGNEAVSHDEAYEAQETSQPQESSDTQAEEEVEAEDLLLSSDEEAPSIKTEQKTKPKTETKPQEKDVTKVQPTQEAKQEPKINPMALYKGKQNKGQASSEGIKEGSGDMGNENGNLSSKNYYGNGGGGGGGISFSLNGRVLKSLVKPEYSSQEQGTVVVRIWVNRYGKVIRCVAGVQGSTTMDENLVEMARQAALKSEFEPKESAPEEQIGTISYKFLIGQ